MERGTFSSGSPSFRTIASTAPGFMESTARRACTNVRGHILSVISSSRSQSLFSHVINHAYIKATFAVECHYCTTFGFREASVV